MLPSLFRRILLGCVVFALLWAPWYVCESGYAWLFRSAASLSFRLVGLEHVSFEPIAEHQGRLDTRLVVREAGGVWTVALNCRFIGLLPAVTFAALFAASSSRSSLHWRGLALGTALVHLYVFGRLLVAYGNGLTRHVSAGKDHGHAAFLGERGWVSTLDVIVRLDSSVAMLMLAPVLVWALVVVCSRGAPSQRLVASVPPPSSTQATAPHDP